MDHLRLVQPVDDFGQGVVVAVAHVADGGFDAGLGQPFGIADRHVWHAAVTVVDECVVTLPAPCVKDRVPRGGVTEVIGGLGLGLGCET